jgi:serine/threonine protein kinase
MYNKGGKVIASGGFGCVFSPALKCEDAQHRESNKITKLMTEKHALQEYKEINNIKQKLDSIPHYTDFFILSDINICRPAPLTKEDLQQFSKTCTALPKDNISQKNINSSLDKIMALNIPNGGLPVDDYIYNNGSFKKIYELHKTLIQLLKKGVVPMNKKNIFHCDIKDSNVLVDTTRGIKTRLIDWGLSTEYIPLKEQPFPNTWRNRPLQFNVPFSVIIFSDDFVEKYTKYLKDGNSSDEIQLRPFVIDYIHYWMKERGNGHYKYINEMMTTLFQHGLTNISESNKQTFIETQITMPYIVDYIIDVLVHFTKWKSDGSLNLREYLDNIFIKIVDIWGFITIYYPLIELLSNNYTELTNHEKQIFNQLKFIMVTYLYNPRHEPIHMNKLYADFTILGNLLNIKFVRKTIKHSLAKGYTKSKSRRQNIHTERKQSMLFKRRPKKQIGKKLIFSSIK